MTIKVLLFPVLWVLLYSGGSIIYLFIKMNHFGGSKYRPTAFRQAFSFFKWNNSYKISCVKKVCKWHKHDCECIYHAIISFSLLFQIVWPYYIPVDNNLASPFHIFMIKQKLFVQDRDSSFNSIASPGRSNGQREVHKVHCCGLPKAFRQVSVMKTLYLQYF